MARLPLEPGTWGEINTSSTTSTGRVRARTRYVAPNGSVHQVEATGKSVAEAKRRLLTRLKSWVTPADKRLFRDVAEEWVADITEHQGLREQSIMIYERLIKTTLNPILGKRVLPNITTVVLDEVLDEIYKTTPGNYQTAFTVIKQILDYAVRRGYAEHNPMASVRKRKTKRKEIRDLTIDELADIRSLARAWQDAPRRFQPILDVIDLLLSTGGRIGEILALKWDDYDETDHTIPLIGTQVWIKGKGIVRQEETKTGARIRVRLTDFAIAMLKDRRAKHPDDVYIFQSRGKGSNMISRSNLDRAWRDIRGEEYKWVTWHTFRKSVATRAAEATDSHTAAKMLGHTNDTITRKHYIATDITAAPDLTAVLEALGGEKVLSFDDEADGESPLHD